MSARIFSKSRRGVLIGIAAVLGSLVSVPLVAAGQGSVLVRMFEWSNTAMRRPGSYTAKAFSAYFTADASLVIDGVVIAKGLDQFERHFTTISASGAKVRIVTPFEEEFRSGNQIYTYHVIQSIRDGVPSCLLAAGHATLRGGKIAVLSLVRARVENGSALFADKCVWNGL